jgi:hypothetical protein
MKAMPLSQNSIFIFLYIHFIWLHVLIRYYKLNEIKQFLTYYNSILTSNSFFTLLTSSTSSLLSTATTSSAGYGGNDSSNALSSPNTYNTSPPSIATDFNSKNVNNVHNVVKNYTNTLQYLLTDFINLTIIYTGTACYTINQSAPTTDAEQHQQQQHGIGHVSEAAVNPFVSLFSSDYLLPLLSVLPENKKVEICQVSE